jgi:hypothetical protein
VVTIAPVLMSKEPRHGFLDRALLVGGVLVESDPDTLSLFVRDPLDPRERDRYANAVESVR